MPISSFFHPGGTERSTSPSRKSRHRHDHKHRIHKRESAIKRNDPNLATWHFNKHTGALTDSSGDESSASDSPHSDSEDEHPVAPTVLRTQPAASFGAVAPQAPVTPMVLPRASYLKLVDQASVVSSVPARPKSKLLVSDLDNTLFGPSAPGDGVVARPYLATFLQYIMHPTTPFNLAIWTFSGRMYGIAHLRQVGMGKYLFDSPDPLHPKMKPGLLDVWGFEDSGFLANGVMAAGRALKDLDLIWYEVNSSPTRSSSQPTFDATNSLIVDDQVPNGRAQPDSIVEAPVFTSKTPDDEFLLAFIGVLEELALESNIANAISLHKLYSGIHPDDLSHYVGKANEVCKRLGIAVERGAAYPDPAPVEDVKQLGAPGPVHDAATEPTVQHPLAKTPFVRPTPNRLADGQLKRPSAEYEDQVKVESKLMKDGKTGRPLVVFDLDGTLYTRPPQNLEHDPAGQPSSRPYLRTFLQWLLSDDSPWSMAIWTGSQKPTAVRCLYELDLGLVGPELIGPNKDQPELLHPKLVSLWAREDLGLTKKDYTSYVSITKDLGKLWKYLDKAGKGDWDATNTVMVDDTPSKLRAHPDTLIAAPTYDYPLAPGPQATTAQTDTFLLALVAMLEDIEHETNTSNYIKGVGWNAVPKDDKEEADLVKRGLDILDKDGIAVAAEGRGLIKGVRPSKYESGVRNAKPVTVQGAFSSIHADHPSSPSVFKPTSSSTQTPQPLTAANLARESGHGTDVNSDTDNKSDTSSSVNGDSDTDASSVSGSESDTPPSPSGMRPATTANTSTSTHAGRFVNEIEGMMADRNKARKGNRSARKRLEDGVEDWENLSEDPDAEPTEVPSPYYQDLQAKKASRGA
ncbi:hypothetical protein JCM11641_006548 [Rhodosporidiobolus odoratus]